MKVENFCHESRQCFVIHHPLDGSFAIQNDWRGSEKKKQRFKDKWWPSRWNPSLMCEQSSFCYATPLAFIGQIGDRISHLQNSSTFFIRYYVQSTWTQKKERGMLTRNCLSCWWGNTHFHFSQAEKNSLHCWNVFHYFRSHRYHQSLIMLSFFVLFSLFQITNIMKQKLKRKENENFVVVSLFTCHACDLKVSDKAKKIVLIVWYTICGCWHSMNANFSFDRRQCVSLAFQQWCHRQPCVTRIACRKIYVPGYYSLIFILLVENFKVVSIFFL